jgi:hypothetical protein
MAGHRAKALNGEEAASKSWFRAEVEIVGNHANKLQSVGNHANKLQSGSARSDAQRRISRQVGPMTWANKRAGAIKRPMARPKRAAE